MSGPNPPGADSEDHGDGREPGFPAGQPDHPAAGHGDRTGETDFFSQAYSAPESEQFSSGPYLPVDLDLYDYDSYDTADDDAADGGAPRWPWVVGVAAILAAIALVVSVSLLFARTDTNKLATPQTAAPSSPPFQDEIIVTTPPPPTTAEQRTSATSATSATDQRSPAARAGAACDHRGTPAAAAAGQQLGCAATAHLDHTGRTPSGHLLGDRHQGAR